METTDCGTLRASVVARALSTTFRLPAIEQCRTRKKMRFVPGYLSRVMTYARRPRRPRTQLGEIVTAGEPAQEEEGSPAPFAEFFFGKTDQVSPRASNTRRRYSHL